MLHIVFRSFLAGFQTRQSLVLENLARDNPLRGAPRIHGELEKLGLIVSEPTVFNYMKRRRPPSQSWKTFLINHAAEIASVDFFEVATATMQVLHVFVVLGHDRRRILRCEITTSPTGEWAAEQLVEALDFDDAPHILIRDRDDPAGLPGSCDRVQCPASTLAGDHTPRGFNPRVKS